MTRVEIRPPAEAGPEATGCETSSTASPPAPDDLSVRTIWQREYTDGWAQGRDQALGTVWTTRRLGAADRPAVQTIPPDPKLVQRAYHRFVDSVGRAPLADFDRFVAEHAFWMGHRDAYDAVLNQHTLLGSTAAERARLPGLFSQAVSMGRRLVARTLHRADLYPGLTLAVALGTLALVIARGIRARRRHI